MNSQLSTFHAQGCESHPESHSHLYIAPSVTRPTSLPERDPSEETTKDSTRFRKPGLLGSVPSRVMSDATKPDVFPLTQGTWIMDRIEAGDQGRRDINRHIMSVYHWPLTIYFRGTRDRYLGDPEDVVQGFFASRLSKPNFFTDWKASGKRLRHWLINGFCFYLKELHRENLRHDRGSGVEMPEPQFEEHTAARDMDDIYLRGMVRRAMIETSQICQQQGLQDHFNIFEAHFYHERPYESVGPQFGVDPTRAAVMARTAKRKFQQTLRELFISDGVSQERVDDEVSGLLRIAGVQTKRTVATGDNKNPQNNDLEDK